VPDLRVERLAGVLVDYSTAVQAGDIVVISASLLAAPLVRSLFTRVVAAGGHAHVRTEVAGELEALLAEGTDRQLEWVNPARVDDIERADVRIAVEAEWNTRAHTGVDPERQARRSRARKPILNRYMERAAAGELRSVVTLFPTDAAAQDAEMSLEDYEEFVYRAGLLDRDDPVAEWQALGRRLAGLASWLDERKEIRVVGEGTDLTLGVEGRTWVASEGRENFPDGEVFTGPVETSVNGTIRFTYPAGFGGRRIAGIELEFEEGEVVRSAAERGGEFLAEMLAVDGGARRVGEFSFGVNDAVQEFTGNTLFDEKMGGTVHLALGASYPETGGKNDSALHWDIVCDLRHGGEVYADGELVYRDGRFLDGVAP
jgi:aminopeptidase